MLWIYSYLCPLVRSLKHAYSWIVSILDDTSAYFSWRSQSSNISEKGTIDCSKELKGNTYSMRVHLPIILNVAGSANTAEVSLFLQVNARTNIEIWQYFNSDRG
jgi:Na+/serine symporter